MAVAYNLNIYLPYDSRNYSLGIYVRENKTYVDTKIV